MIVQISGSEGKFTNLSTIMIFVFLDNVFYGSSLTNADYRQVLCCEQFHTIFSYFLEFVFDKN